MVKRVAVFAAGIAWATLCVAVLISALHAYSGVSDWRTEEILAFQMMALTFPASLVVYVGIVLAGVALGLFGVTLPMPSRTEMICGWMLFFAAGCLQWFVLLPRLLTAKADEGMATRE